MPIASSTRLRPGHVLVVDDDPILARSIARWLSQSHVVDIDPSGRAALARLLGGQTYDVVLSDINMPELSGIGLHEELYRRLPAVARRMVFMTGDPDERTTRAFLDRIDNIWMAKPLDLDSLDELIVRRIREPALRGRASSHDI